MKRCQRDAIGSLSTSWIHTHLSVVALVIRGNIVGSVGDFVGEIRYAGQDVINGVLPLTTDLRYGAHIVDLLL